jgi:hypothetical protein
MKLKSIVVALSASFALSANIRAATGATGTADPSTATGAAEALAVTAPTATGAADATFAQSTSSKTPPTTTGPWLDNIKKSITELTTFSENKDKERDEVCQREFAAIKSELDQQAKDEADDKKNQKLNLASALDARIAGFGAALDKLMALMKQLKGHIDNVNVIFQSKYAQDQRDMQVAGEAFESLMTHATEGNPKDVPIKVPILPNFNVSFVELKTGLAMERLANMEQRLARHLAQSDELPQCEDAHQAAVGLFQKGARYHEEIKQFFSAERKVLAAFREQLASVMRSKLAKLAKLKAQSALLKKSMATPEGKNNIEIYWRGSGYSGNPLCVGHDWQTLTLLFIYLFPFVSCFGCIFWGATFSGHGQSFGRSLGSARSHCQSGLCSNGRSHGIERTEKKNVGGQSKPVRGQHGHGGRRDHWKQHGDLAQQSDRSGGRRGGHHKRDRGCCRCIGPGRIGRSNADYCRFRGGGGGTKSQY